MWPQMVDPVRLEREVSAARLRALALVPFSPAWDAAMDRVEELERTLWRLDPVRPGEDLNDSIDRSRNGVPV